MRKIKNKLIVSDFDGTLLTSGQTIPENVKNLIAEYVGSGGIFTVCTGRMLNSILPRVRSLGLSGLIAANHGAVIADVKSGEVIRNNYIPVSETAEICRYLESLNQNINVYTINNFYTDLPSDSEVLHIYENIIGVKAVNVSGKISDYIEKNGLKCENVTCIVAPEKMEKLYKTLSAKFGGKYQVTYSASTLVEVIGAGSNKAEAMKYIAQYYGIPLNSAVAVGDSLNDLSMICAAGTGVAVGNAVPALKQAADYVSVTNDMGAVGEVINKYGFE